MLRKKDKNEKEDKNITNKNILKSVIKNKYFYRPNKYHPSSVDRDISLCIIHDVFRALLFLYL